MVISPKSLHPFMPHSKRIHPAEAPHLYTPDKSLRTKLSEMFKEETK